MDSVYTIGKETLIGNFFSCTEYGQKLCLDLEAKKTIRSF